MIQKQHPVKKFYNPSHLLDTLIHKLGVANDKGLSRRLKVQPSVITNIRHRRTPVAASLLMWIHQETGIDVQELRDWLGDRRAKFRMRVINSAA